MELGIVPFTPYLMAVEGRPLIREEDIGRDNRDLAFPHNGMAMQVVHVVLLDTMHS